MNVSYIVHSSIGQADASLACWGQARQGVCKMPIAAACSYMTMSKFIKAAALVATRHLAQAAQPTRTGMPNYLSHR